ncbi:MAG: hypothetical protein LQ351_000989 [Letrouitia transgressa]|nr:MAG: hypothetical protein LQ351_000989 [Letrouitia transgressa]
MVEEETLSAAISIIRELAKYESPPHTAPVFPYDSTNGSTQTNGTSAKPLLPGPPSVLKRSLEKELTALSSRVQFLKTRADTINHPALPDTPNDSGGPTSPFGAHYSLSQSKKTSSAPARSHSGSARRTRVSNLLSGGSRSLSDEDLEHLREHVEKQAQEIKDQKEVIANVGEQLVQHQNQSKQYLLKVEENDDLTALHRELVKHQQANEAFKKALKEIGTIVNNVANGDLSLRVKTSPQEVDSDIKTFKETINRMMDQLQRFGSEVSRVAREVGTEGNLGGQAQITGVFGIWKELTNNGM